jgi:hypothetical protein
MAVWVSPLAAQVKEDKRVTAHRIENGIIVDGELDEAEWQLVEPATGFLQQDPQTGEPSTETTEVRILYDEENLYLGAYLFDSAGGEAIIVNDMRRDFVPFSNDTFIVVLDTFNDNRNAFFFSVNPSGAKFDMQASDDGRKRNRDWDGIWYSKAKITERGWQAEIAIPFKTLRFSNLEDQVWGINFQRRIRHKNELAFWSLVPRPYLVSRVSYAGTLEGLSGIRPGRNLYVKPYVSAPVVRRQGDDVDFLPDAGIDLKYGVQSQLTLDITVNTDFSQVEADEQQINLTRFSLFFPEKRDFFLENATIFQLGPGGGGGLFGGFRDLIPFFSRRIGLLRGEVVPILGGARLTGRTGKYTLGLLSLQDDETQAKPSTNYSVVRVSRDILRSSDVGGIFINKQEIDGDFNRTYGADGNFTFYNFLNIRSFLLQTSTPNVSDQNVAGVFFIDWTQPQMTLEGSYLSIQDNFNAEVGFVPRTGIRKSTGTFAYRLRPGERIPAIREFEPSLNIQYITNQDNVLESRALEGRFPILFQNSSELSFAGKSNFERLTEPFVIRPDRIIPVGDYSFDEFSFSASSDNSRMLSGSLELTTGGFFDGDKDSYEFSGTFQLPQFRAELSWRHDDVTIVAGDFETELVTARVNYSFNPSMFLNALIQYNSELGEVSSNIRFNIIHKPLSDFFLVYNERRSSTREVLERALIAKLTYVFSF